MNNYQERHILIKFNNYIIIIYINFKLFMIHNILHYNLY